MNALVGEMMGLGHIKGECQILIMKCVRDPKPYHELKRLNKKLNVDNLTFLIEYFTKSRCNNGRAISTTTT